jgi:hypothetical protein
MDAAYTDGPNQSAEIAAHRLRKLVFETRDALKAAHGEKALEVSVKRRLGRVFSRNSGTGGYTLIFGKPVWILSASARAVGIEEDGGLGVTDDGELVLTRSWLTVHGEGTLEAGYNRRILDRAAVQAGRRGFSSAVAIAAQVEAFGAPQLERRFRARNSEFRNAFYLDGSGKLVFGSPEGSVDAAQWFSAVVTAKTDRQNHVMTGVLHSYFNELRSRPRAAAIKAAANHAATRVVGVDDQNADGRKPGPRTGRLAFDAAMVDTVAQAMRGGTDISSSGSVAARQFSSADPTEGGITANRLLDVLPVTVRPSATSGYSHWVQIRPDSLGNPALEAGEPLTGFDDRVARVDKCLESLSYSSAVLDKALLQDAAEHRWWLADEIIYRLRSAVEMKIVDDICKCTPVQMVEFETSPLVSIRKGLTHLPVADWHKAAVVIHPSDWETFELALAPVKDSAMPFEPAPRMLFGTPVIVTNAACAGQALVLGPGAVGLSIDGNGVRVRWGNAPGFGIDEVVVEIQGSYQTDVYRPFAVVLVELA